MKQETIGWQWHQLDRMQIICTSLQIENHPSTSSLKVLTGWTLFLTPNQHWRFGAVAAPGSAARVAQNYM